MSGPELQALLSAADAARQSGRLCAVREQAGPKGATVLSAKFVDSFGFVDHPRLTAAQGDLLDFHCDCPRFRRTRQFCCHCAALAADQFGELSPAPASGEAEEPPCVPLKLLLPEDPEPAESAQAPDVEQISYAFCNCAQHLYPGKPNPRIPLARYDQIFGRTARARMLYASSRRWGGSCFGISTTASMFFLPDDPVTAPDFRVGALRPADLLLTSRSKELHMTLHTFLEGMQIIQMHELISRPRSQRLRDPGCLDELCRRVLHFQQTQTWPVVMSVWRTPKFDGGHTVFPYWLETPAEGQDRLYIYDPNYPMTTRYAYLEKDADGHYTNWRFPMNDHTEYSSLTGGQLSFEPYADYKQAWNRRGGEEPEAMMAVPREAAIAGEDGTLLFRVTKDGTESFCQHIFQIPLTDLADDGEELVLLSLPAGTYLVRNEDPGRESLRVRFSHTAQSVTLCTNAREAAVTADDSAMCVSARIPQSGCSYSIELDALFEEDQHRILLEGTTGPEGLHLRCQNGSLCAEGTLNKDTAALYLDEELTDLCCIRQEEAAQPIRQLLTNTDTDEPADTVQ